MVNSPCIKNCKLEHGKCSGCKRTLDEIANWKNMTESEKEKVKTRIQIDSYWPSLTFPPINLYVLHSARWNNF